MKSEQWFYVVGQDSKGPFESHEIEDLIAQGVIGPQSLVWHEGLPVWETAALHFEMPGVMASHHPGMAMGGQIGPDGLYVGAPSRNLGEAFKVCMGKYATFSGRASRSEYWYFVLWQFLIGFVTGFIDGFVLGATGDLSPLNTIGSLILFIPGLAVAWRRLHDIDRSGWWIGGAMLATVAITLLAAMSYDGIDTLTGAESGLGLVLLGVAAIGIVAYLVVILVFYCTRGTLGPNRYG